MIKNYVPKRLNQYLTEYVTEEPSLAETWVAVVSKALDIVTPV